MRAWLLALTACGRIGFPEERRGDAGTGSADAPLADAVMLPTDPCGTTVLAQDGFDDAVPAPLFQSHADTGLTVTEAASALTVTFAASVSGGSYGYYRSVNAYTAEGLCATVEVATVPAASQIDAAAYAKLRTAQLEIEFFEHGGALDLRTHNGNMVMILATVPYDASLRFWRLRQQSGTSYWDTSSDGVTFTQQLAMPGFAVTNCQLELGGGAAATVTNAGSASFPGVTLTGP